MNPKCAKSSVLWTLALNGTSNQVEQTYDINYCWVLKYSVT